MVNIAIRVSVCLSVCVVCLSARISKNTYRFHQIFCTYYLWLGPPLTAMQRVVYFRFRRWRHVYNNEVNRPESKTTCMFCPVRQVAAPAEKSAIFDCILFSVVQISRSGQPYVRPHNAQIILRAPFMTNWMILFSMAFLSAKLQLIKFEKIIKVQKLFGPPLSHGHNSNVGNEHAIRGG